MKEGRGWPSNMHWVGGDLNGNKRSMKAVCGRGPIKNTCIKTWEVF